MRWIYLGLSLCFVVLTAVLFIREQPAIIMATSPRSYSWYQTDPLETIRIDTIINRPDSYYVDAEYIEQVSITDGTTALSMTIVSIHVEEDPIVVDGEDYTIVQWILRPSIQLSNTIVQLEEAYLGVHYASGETVELYLGDLHYVFQSTTEDHLALSGLTATHELIGGIDTVSAIQLELSNQTDGLLVIQSVDVLSDVVTTNTSQMVRDVNCADVKSVTDCLGIEQYPFFVASIPSNLHDVILPQQDLSFYIPLSYQESIPFHRFVIQVAYQVDGKDYMLYLDDFPFIRTARFQSQYEEEYVWYVIDSDS